MTIWLSVILFALGVVLVVKCGDLFVDAAGWIAEVSGIPKFIIGATVVSVATTLPEMIVSVIAAYDGKVDMAVGNAVGSVTANTGLILAIAFIFMAVTIKRRDYITQITLVIAAAAVIWAASLAGEFKLYGSIALLVIFAVYIFDNLRSAKAHAEKSTDKLKFVRSDALKNILKFVFGAAGIVVGSRLLVDSGSAIAGFLGVPERIIAVTLVAVGTSLPELVTTITAITKKQTSLSVGNIIGANIIDLSLILPLCALVSGRALPIAPQSILLDMPICLLLMAVAFVPLLLRKRSSKLQGIVMLLLYVGYLVAVVL